MSDVTRSPLTGAGDNNTTDEREMRVRNLMAIGMSRERAVAAVVADDARPRSSIPRSSIQSYRPTRCRVCGAAPTRWSRIYRSGECRECYLDRKDEEVWE